jgi:hypothetical protein
MALEQLHDMILRTVERERMMQGIEMNIVMMYESIFIQKDSGQKVFK